MIVFVYTIFSFYLLFLIGLILGWKKSLNSKLTRHSSVVKISVLIPLRNEAANLTLLFDKLNQQRVDRHLFEVIFINDHSTDESETIYQEQQENLRFQHTWLVLPKDEHGKKAALALGIKQARHPIILTTDADAFPTEEWIENYSTVFADEKIQFAFGLVVVQPAESIFSKMQHMEFASLMGTAAASLAYGVPTMCNGANMAFRKSAYEAVGGYQSHQHLASGDDEFLYHAIAKSYPKGVHFLPNSSATVFVNAKPTLKSFVAQRVRWAGKWRWHLIFPMKLLAIFIFLFQLCWLTLPIVLYFSFPVVNFLFFLAALKILLEAWLISNVSNSERINFNLLSFILLQVLYAPYAIISGVLATFSAYSWKDRVYQN